MKKKQVTSADVARVAGVSQSAVSRTFTPGASVSEKTRHKVLAATRLLGYKPNAIARSLITQRTNIIGVVVGDTINPFYSEVLENATRRLQAAGRQVMLFLTTPDLDPGQALPQALQYQVDGVVIATAALLPHMVADYAKVGTPMVLINRIIEGFDVPAVHIDNESGVRMAADFLVDAGHMKLAFVNGIQTSSGNATRRRIFIERVAERGLPPPIEDVGYYTYEGGFRAATRLMLLKDRPDAIFCANDMMALGGLNAIRHYLGLRVPEDVAIIGFDDVPAAAWPNVRLTTIHVDVRELVRRAVEMLLMMVDSGNTKIGIERVPVHLVVRDTAVPSIRQKKTLEAEESKA